MSSPSEVPDLVQHALRESVALGFLDPTRHETGRLLATLAAAYTGTIADLGTGSGAAAAWLRLGAPSGTRVVTVEIDQERAEHARQVLTGSGIEVLTGDQAALAELAPFSLLHLDHEIAASADRERLCRMVTPGGQVVLTEFPGGPTLSPEDVLADLTRQEWMSDERFESTEVTVAEDAVVLICTLKP